MLPARASIRPESLVIAYEGAFNLAATVANGEVMPASASALNRAGIGDSAEFSTSGCVDDARLQWLGDILVIPAEWPLSNVFSIGDIVVVGIGYRAHLHCRPPQVPTSTVTVGV